MAYRFTFTLSLLFFLSALSAQSPFAFGLEFSGGLGFSDRSDYSAKIVWDRTFLITLDLGKNLSITTGYGTHRFGHRREETLPFLDLSRRIGPIRLPGPITIRRESTVVFRRIPLRIAKRIDLSQNISLIAFGSVSYNRFSYFDIQSWNYYNQPNQTHSRQMNNSGWNDDWGIGLGAGGALHFNYKGTLSPYLGLRIDGLPTMTVDSRYDSYFKASVATGVTFRF